ncbi:MAG: glycosyltransferase family 4 protein [Magnetococcus sp. WYHC-3]
MSVLALCTDAYGGRGGIAQYNRDLLDALAVAFPRQQVTLLLRLCPDDVGNLPPTVNLDRAALGGKVAYALRALWQGWRRYDLILCGHINLLPLAQTLGRLSGTPVVLLCYGIEVWRPPSAHSPRRMAALAGVVSISRITEQRLRQWAPATPAAAILPNAIHLEYYRQGDRPHALVQRYGLQGRRVLMTMGRMVGRERAKGFDEVLEALPRLPDDVVYLLAGDGPDRERLRARAAELGVSQRAVFTGYVDATEKADHYLLADLYVMPSRGEGFGFVLLEALAAGIPCVGSTRDGTREALDDGTLGELVDPDDRDALVAAILRGLARPRGRPPGLAQFATPAWVARTREIFAPWLSPGGA